MEEEEKEVKEKKERSSKNNTFKEKTISFFKNKYNILFLVVLFLAFLIRLKYIGQESIWNDAAVHLWFTIKATKDPFYIFTSEYLMGDYATIQTLTVLFYTFTRDFLVAGKITAVLFGITSIIFMYLLGYELKNKFTGLIAAALLAFHHLFWFYGVRLLADGPLVAMVVIVLYCLVKLEKKKNLFWGFGSALVFLGLFLTKRQSIIFFTAFLIYLVIFKRKEIIKSKAILVSWLVPVSSIVLGSLVFGGRFLKKYLNEWIRLDGLNDPGLNATNHFVWIFSWYLLIPIVLGILFIIVYKKKEYYLNLVFFIFYWVAFELIVRMPEDRYILPLLPMGIILATFGLIEFSKYLILFIGQKKIRNYVGKGAVLIFAVFVCWNFYTIGDSLTSSKSNSYAGHVEAGRWLKENVPDGTPIFVGSPRMQRPFIEREYGGPPDYPIANKTGSLWYLRALRYQGRDNNCSKRDCRYDPEDPVKGKKYFEEDLKKLLQKSDVYLEIDIWEYTQPKWYFPITQNSLNYFQSLGFQLVKVVEREVNTQQGKRKMPVIFLFKKSQEKNSS